MAKIAVFRTLLLSDTHNLKSKNYYEKTLFRWCIMNEGSIRTVATIKNAPPIRFFSLIIFLMLKHTGPHAAA